MSLRPPFDKFELEAPHCFADWRLIHIGALNVPDDPIIENKLIAIVPGLRASWSSLRFAAAVGASRASGREHTNWWENLPLDGLPCSSPPFALGTAQ